MAEQRQPIVNISKEERNRARRERDRARRNSLTAAQKEEINYRARTAWQKNSLDERNTRKRANRKNISTKERQEMNANRRARRQSIPEHEREALLAQRKANAEARRNTLCAQSIAMSCPNAAALATVNPTSSKHISPTRDGDDSPLVSPSGSTLDYNIRSDGDSPIFTLLLMLRLIESLLTC